MSGRASETGPSLPGGENLSIQSTTDVVCPAGILTNILPVVFTPTFLDRGIIDILFRADLVLSIGLAAPTDIEIELTETISSFAASWFLPSALILAPSSIIQLPAAVSFSALMRDAIGPETNFVLTLQPTANPITVKAGSTFSGWLVRQPD